MAPAPPRQAWDAQRRAPGPVEGMGGWCGMWEPLPRPLCPLVGWREQRCTCCVLTGTCLELLSVARVAKGTTGHLCPISVHGKVSRCHLARSVRSVCWVAEGEVTVVTVPGMGTGLDAAPGQAVRPSPAASVCALRSPSDCTVPGRCLARASSCSL